MRDDLPLPLPLPLPLHTPQKAIPRRIKYNVDRIQKHQKSSRKDSLDISTFSDVTEENHVAESTESNITNSTGISTSLEVSEDNHVAESTESFTTSLIPFDSTSSVHGPSPTSGITLLSSLSSPATTEPLNLSVICNGSHQSDSEVAGSLEMELVVKHLQQLMLHNHISADTDLRYKKLLDGLVKIVIEEFCSLPQERDWLIEIISRRSLMVLLSLIFWALVLSTVILLSKSAQSIYSGPPPT